MMVHTAIPACTLSTTSTKANCEHSFFIACEAEENHLARLKIAIWLNAHRSIKNPFSSGGISELVKLAIHLSVDDGLLLLEVVELLGDAVDSGLQPVETFI